jgi:small-conductance mechanosensitive channel
MDTIMEFLNTTAFTLGGYEFSVMRLLFIPLVLICGILLIRWGDRLIARRLVHPRFNADVVQFSRRAFFIAMLVLLAFILLDLLNLPLTAFAFVSGAIAIGVGFGAQNIINNFISGWILMWERPIRIGDLLELGQDRGRVEAINTRYTRIRRVDGVHLLIPNSALLENTVVNWTLIDRNVRSFVQVGVQYGSPVTQVRELIEQSVDEHPDILKEPESVVLFTDFGDSALVFEAYFWIHAANNMDLRRVRSDIRFQIDELFRQHGIVIAFPQRDVHIDGSVLIDRRELEPGT